MVQGIYSIVLVKNFMIQEMNFMVQGMNYMIQMKNLMSQGNEKLLG